MVKKTVKMRTKELFQEFLNTKGFGVYNDGFMSSNYSIRKPKASENKIPSDFYIDDILDTNIDNISNTKAFFDFITDSLKKCENEVALYQSIKKTPGPKNYSYDSHVGSIIDVLKPYKKILFQYVARPKFLENSWSKIENVFETIDSQEYRIAIIEAMTQTKTFTSLDTQKSIYNIVQQHIRNPSKFDSYFNRITKVNENQSVVDFIDTPSIVVIGFTVEKLIGANLNTELSSNNLVEGIRTVSESLKDKHDNSLGVKSVFMNYDKEKKQYSLNIICSQPFVELNKIVFERCINDLSRLNKWQDISSYNQDNILKNIIRESQAINLHDTLKNNLLAEKEQARRPKNKI